jgi:hypothetical protein
MRHSSESVQCDKCKNFYHMGCVQPPLSAKPSRGYGWACGPCSRQHDDDVDKHQLLTRVGIPPPKPKSNAPPVRGRGRPRKDQQAREKDDKIEVKHFRMWPFRYFGCVVSYMITQNGLKRFFSGCTLLRRIRWVRACYYSHCSH